LTLLMAKAPLFCLFGDYPPKFDYLLASESIESRRDVSL
jgi:hypothetical protein